MTNSDLKRVRTTYTIRYIKQPGRGKTPDFGLFGRARFTNASMFVDQFAADSKVMEVFFAIYNIELLNRLTDGRYCKRRATC